MSCAIRNAADSGRCAEICANLIPTTDHGSLLAGLQQLFPDLGFQLTLSRGGWYRLGGVVDREGRRIADSVTAWAERESGGEVIGLLDTYADAGYVATRIQGRTHYLCAPCGPRPQDFVQLEVEEIQEVMDRPLIAPDWFPDSLEEFADPVDYPRVPPNAVAPPRYLLRRWLDVAAHLEAREPADGTRALERFLTDWAQSSAGESVPFCRYWVLSLQESVDRDGEPAVSVKPVPADVDAVSLPEYESFAGGAPLANFIHGFDRAAGYHMAWYFHLLGGRGVPCRIAQAVYADQMGAYDYLPPRDLGILRAWVEAPYTP